jgi:iron complex transport system permease protein
MIALLAILLAVVAVALFVGTVSISVAQAWSVLLDRLGIGESATTAGAVFWSIRLPRVLAAVIVGAALGLSGAAIQGLYRNPLADPYLVGVSSAAGLGAVIGIVLTSAGGYPLATIALAAAAGAGFALLTRRIAAATVDPTRFLLVGVALGIALLAWTVVLVFIADSPRLPTFTYFIFGSFGGVTWKGIAAALPLAVAGCALIAFSGRAVDLFALGDREAQHLGVDVGRSSAIVLIGVGIAVGATVGLAGVIGFVGLLAPFAVRRWMGASHRALFPAAAILGAAFVVAADLSARILADPVEVPVGIITAAVGGPLLVVLLMRRQRVQA